MDDAGSLDFWRPLLGPLLFIVGAVVLFVALLFVAAVTARLVLALTRFLLRPWWHTVLSVILTVALVATDVVSGPTAAGAWVALLVVAALSWLFLTIAGRGGSPATRQDVYRPCSFCHESGTRDGNTCGLCGGSGRELVRT